MKVLSDAQLQSALSTLTTLGDNLVEKMGNHTFTPELSEQTKEHKCICYAKDILITEIRHRQSARRTKAA